MQMVSSPELSYDFLVMLAVAVRNATLLGLHRLGDNEALSCSMHEFEDRLADHLLECHQMMLHCLGGPIR